MISFKFKLFPFVNRKANSIIEQQSRFFVISFVNRKANSIIDQRCFESRFLVKFDFQRLNEQRLCELEKFNLSITTLLKLVIYYELSCFLNLSRKSCCDAIVATKCSF